MKIFTAIRRNLPWVNRISLYGNAKSILRKTPDELRHLKKLGLDRVYMGLESGHDPTLKSMGKGVNSEQMVEAAQMVREAGLFLSVSVMLGIAGRADSLEHAHHTGHVLTRMKPNQIAVLTLMLLENTPLHSDVLSGSYQMPDQKMLLAELQHLVEAIDLDRVQFQANHASNYLPLSGRLAKDKNRILQAIAHGQGNRRLLKAEYLRAL